MFKLIRHNRLDIFFNMKLSARKKRATTLNVTIFGSRIGWSQGAVVSVTSLSILHVSRINTKINNYFLNAGI